ncbi:Ff.00g084860.m01.CDS01 [Fusarium sp. VM40]|nr:Ff.00g084860.m01.CDS01 [Fusarium sp. VM40]
MATVEINDAVFCQAHLKECDECEVDLREENDAFYGLNSTDRDALELLPATLTDDGLYSCAQHESSSLTDWKSQPVLRVLVGRKLS